LSFVVVAWTTLDEPVRGQQGNARGGLGQLVAFQESDVRKSTFKGLAGVDPPAPELVRIKKDDPSHAMKFDFAIQAPNE